MDVRRIIARRRRELGITQRELASATGMRQPHLSAWLSGRRRYVDTAALEQMLELLGIRLFVEEAAVCEDGPVRLAASERAVPGRRRW